MCLGKIWSHKGFQCPPVSLDPIVDFLCLMMSSFTCCVMVAWALGGGLQHHFSSSVRYKCPVLESSVLGRNVSGIHMHEWRLGNTRIVTESLSRYLSPPWATLSTDYSLFVRCGVHEQFHWSLSLSPQYL